MAEVEIICALAITPRNQRKVRSVDGGRGRHGIAEPVDDGVVRCVRTLVDLEPRPEVSGRDIPVVRQPRTLRSRVLRIDQLRDGNLDDVGIGQIRIAIDERELKRAEQPVHRRRARDRSGCAERVENVERLDERDAP